MSKPSLTLLILSLAACGAGTEPSSANLPFAEWELRGINGGGLPVPVHLSGATTDLVAETLDLRRIPGREPGVGALIYHTREASGRVTRGTLRVGYVIDGNRIGIDFHCFYVPGCFANYDPLFAVLTAGELVFLDRLGERSRRYVRAR